MIFVKISQNFIKSHLKICLNSQISVHSSWHVCQADLRLCRAHSHFVGFVMRWLNYRRMTFHKTIFKACSCIHGLDNIHATSYVRSVDKISTELYLYKESSMDVLESFLTFHINFLSNIIKLPILFAKYNRFSTTTSENH